MKILIIKWNAFGKDDIEEAFLAEGHGLVRFPISTRRDARNDPEVEKDLTTMLRGEVPDVVFSLNYFPLVSNVCNKEHIPYLSWVYDCPYVRLYSYTILNPCNTVYIFDRELYLEFYNAGIPTVRYLPLAANTERLDLMDQGNRLPYLYDISFVGSLYTESHNFYDRMKNLSDYARGYLNGLMTAQMKVQGYNFIQESLGPVMDDLYQALPMDPNPDGAETREFLYAQYVINRKITGLERVGLLQTITHSHIVDLFTYDSHFTLPNLCNHGKVEAYEEMPKVFKRSKINLNITLRSIKSGIPLRGFDIMGSGGFLLSNFQGDFLEFFIPGEDFVYYENEDDLIRKIDYYLRHGDEREEIARNGHNKVAEGHTYRHRVREMLGGISGIFSKNGLPETVN